MSEAVLAKVRHALAAEVVTDRRAVLAIGVGSAVLATALGAQVRVGAPVPITLQTFFVLLSGALLGCRWGALAQGLYVGLGAAGVPLFAASAGLRGPTVGYLIGFVVAAWLIGRVLSRAAEPSLARGALAMLSGSLVIYALGAGWLMALGLPPAKALAVGVAPFLPGDAAKLAMACAIWWRLRRRARALFG